MRLLKGCLEGVTDLVTFNLTFDLASGGQLCIIAKLMEGQGQILTHSATTRPSAECRWPVIPAISGRIGPLSRYDFAGQSNGRRLPSVILRELLIHWISARLDILVLGYWTDLYSVGRQSGT